ncbi:hypothetical protein SK128_004990 [Halocaridina rubra]|uniref:Uncharacterized protein n=1 Tax=Halocaridina rubra TaxID=373956 RepID=A0AAN9A1B0_HALRR
MATMKEATKFCSVLKRHRYASLRNAKVMFRYSSPSFLPRSETLWFCFVQKRDHSVLLRSETHRYCSFRKRQRFAMLCPASLQPCSETPFICRLQMGQRSPSYRNITVLLIQQLSRSLLSYSAKPLLRFVYDFIILF